MPQKSKNTDIIQKITQLKKSNVPYNSTNNKNKILKDNYKFYKEQKQRLYFKLNSLHH